MHSLTSKQQQQAEALRRLEAALQGKEEALQKREEALRKARAELTEQVTNLQYLCLDYLLTKFFLALMELCLSLSADCCFLLAC